MRAEGGQIYQGNRFTEMLPGGQTDVSHLANRGVQEQLDRSKQQALQLYEQGLKISATQGMEEIYNNYKNDPEGLSAELNKLNEKMLSEIPDMGMKVAFRTNFITQSGSLINKAQANYEKIQYEKKKSSYFDTIQANNKSIATALNNAFNGTGTADDLVNYQTAIKQNQGLINARNEDGTYIFSDAQRLSMSNAVDKLASESFESALTEMDDDKRTQVIEALSNDSMILLQGEDEGEVKQLNLKDTFSPEIYADMKKTAKIADNKIKKQQLEEYNLNKKYSTMMLNVEGGEQNYKIWEFYHKDATDEKKAQMRKIAGFMPNEETVTSFEGYKDAYQSIKELSKMPNSTQDEKEKIIEKATDVIQRLNKSNEEENQDGTLSEKDLTKLKQEINDILSDDVFKKQVSNLPDMGVFEKLFIGADERKYYPIPIKNTVTAASNIGKSIFAKSDIGDIAQATMEDIRRIVEMPDLDERSKKRAIDQRYKQGIEDAIRAKYYWIPDLQKPLIENETILNINGTQYLYKGIGDDIFLEIKE